MSKSPECLIIGAGMAGLLTASRLQEAGIRSLVIETQSEVGGRMAVWTFAGEPKPVFDHGAQFFTVRDPRFHSLVEEWLAAGIVAEWSRGFATADGSFYADGHPRYRGLPDMAAIPRYLARNLDVCLGQEVLTVEHVEKGWQATTVRGESYFSAALLLTTPVPQSLAILDAGSVTILHDARQALESITYEPCIALMVQLAGPSRVPEPGGMWPIGEPIAWLADNHLKGVSPVPGSVTIHAGPEFSQEYRTAGDGEITKALLEAVDEWLGAEVKATQVRRWRYSKPLRTHPEPYLALSEPAPLIFAGDAFAGPRVEGAVLSGLEAANRLMQLLDVK